MAVDDFMAGLPLIGGLFDDSDEQAKIYLDKILKQYEGLDAPDVSWKDFTPEMYQSTYSPESMNASLVGEDPLLIQAQRDYLARLSGLSQTGESEGDRAGYALARSEADAMAKSNRDALARQAMAQGTYGGGVDFVSRQMSDQNAAEMARRSALEQAQNAARQKALYAQAYGEGLGNMRNQDMTRESTNKDIINKFNMMNTTNRNIANQGREALNNRNVDLRNQAQAGNLQGRIQQNQAGFNNQVALAGGRANAYDTAGGYYANRGAGRRAQRQGLGGAIGTAIGGPLGGAAGEALGDLF